MNGIHPGPLIVAQKVSQMSCKAQNLVNFPQIQGDRFDVTVTNKLTDPSITLDTSIVRRFLLSGSSTTLTHSYPILVCSTGMESSNEEPLGQMDLKG